MKKRPFILLELFIALSLVAFFSLPLVQGQFFYVKHQKNRLLDLEKERKVEEFFYKICKTLTKTHPLDQIPFKISKKQPFLLEENKVTFDLGKLGKETLYWHYHLYSNVANDKPCRKLRCKICFLNNLQEDCKTPKSFADAKYGFILTIERSLKKSPPSKKN